MNSSCVVNIVKQSSQLFWLLDWWLFSHDYQIVPSADWKGEWGTGDDSRSGEGLESAVLF